MLTLEQQLTRCDIALQNVEKYRKGNPDLYESIKNHIELEWITPAYMMLALYSGDISSARKSDLAARLLETTDKLGIIRTAESGTTTIGDFVADIMSR